MKYSSKVWTVPFLGMVLITAAVPVRGQQNQPGPSTPQQLAQQAELMQRQAMAESIVTRDEAALGRKFDPKFRSLIVKGLTSKSLVEMSQIPTGSAASSVPDALGDTANDLVYTPVTPCRIIDTRIAGGPIPAGTTRSFFAAGANFTGQGGVAGSCGIPLGPATAVVINFVAVSPTAPGDFRVFPFGAPLPLASILNYIPNQNVANGVPVAICNPAVSMCGFDITILAEAAASNVVADVEGYFARPSPQPDLWAVVNSTGTLARGFHATGSTLSGTGVFTVDFDRDVTACAYTATIGLSGTSGASAPGFVTVVGLFGDSHGLFIETFTSAGGLASLGFHVHVMC